MNTWHCGDIRFKTSPTILAICNVTPDSFSDGGKYNSLNQAVDHACAMYAVQPLHGADIIDVGGESTRPNASPVASAAEIDRVMPVVEALLAESIPVSVDTSNPQLIQLALDAGVIAINDVRALAKHSALQIIARHNNKAGLCLMHMQGSPPTMQNEPQYTDVVNEVCAFLQQTIIRCIAVGIEAQRITIDPGIGFGKRPNHNIKLLQQITKLATLHPEIAGVMIGVSRKSLLAALTNRPIHQRQAATLAAELYAVQHGARVIRTHDPHALTDAITVSNAISQQ